jgi:hypothetical protein
MPRAAVLSIHARVEGARPTTWEDRSLVQIWGPRYNAYVVAERDLAVFTLGRLAEAGTARDRAEDLAARLHALIGDRRIGGGDAGRALGGHPSSIRYAAPTGTVLIRWDGARQPDIWSVPRPDVDPRDARLELARRYLHIFGPATAGVFARWAGIPASQGADAFAALRRSLTPVTTPVGEAWILTRDVATMRTEPEPPAAARLLPSGDAFFLVHDDDRRLLVPDVGHRRQLWPSRVWPGAVLAGGEIVGTWRRAGERVVVSPWQRLTRSAREAIEAEATSLPLPGVEDPIVIEWEN